MLPLMPVPDQGGKFIQCVKHGLTARHLPVGPPRKPLQIFNKRKTSIRASDSNNEYND